MTRAITKPKAQADDATTTLGAIVRRLRARVAADERFWHILPVVKAAENALAAGKLDDVASFVIEIEAAIDANPRPRAWNILRVAPHMERRVRDTLAEAGLQVYVPIEKRWPRGFHRMTRAEKMRARPLTRPLIPGLIFALLPDDESLDIARANKAAKLMNDGEGPVKVRALEVGSLILFEAFHAFDETWTPPGVRRGKRRGKGAVSRWKSGQRVKVTEGPFAGFLGTIMRADRADRIEVLVSIFGRTSPAEMDEDWVEEAAEAA